MAAQRRQTTPAIDLVSFPRDDPCSEGRRFAFGVIHRRPCFDELVLRARWVFHNKPTCDASFAISCTGGQSHPWLRRSDVCYDFSFTGPAETPVLNVASPDGTAQQTLLENCGLVGRYWGNMGVDAPPLFRQYYLVAMLPNSQTTLLIHDWQGLVEIVSTETLKLAKRHQINPRKWSDTPAVSPWAIMDVSRSVQLSYNRLLRLDLQDDDIEFLQDNDFSWLPIACRTMRISEVEVRDERGAVCDRTLRSHNHWIRPAHPYCSLPDRTRVRNFVSAMRRRRIMETAENPSLPPELWQLILSFLTLDQPALLPVLKQHQE
jgi:hypothetical protein